MVPRILFILHLPPPTHGASMVGKYILDSLIIRQEVNGNFINLATSRNLEEVATVGVRKWIRLFFIQSRVFHSLWVEKYDLCYITINASGAGFYKDLLVVSVVKLFQKKILYHFHNKGVADASISRLNRFLYRFAFSGTSSILLSEHLSYDIARYVKKDDIYFCANGIPTFMLLPVEKINSERPCKILFLSNMIVEKGVYILLDACRVLKNRGLIFECNFVGAWSDVTEKDFAKLLISLDLTDMVMAHGKKIGEDKEQIYLSSDIFILPTYYHNECFPLVLLEAMQFSLPIVTTSEGGISDIVIDGITGYLVPKKDPDVLADRIELLIRNPTLRKTMGQEGRKRFDELFTLEKFEHRLSFILRHAADQKVK